MSASAGFRAMVNSCRRPCVCVQMQPCLAWVGALCVAATLLKSVQSVATTPSSPQTGGLYVCCSAPTHTPTHPT